MSTTASPKSTDPAGKEEGASGTLRLYVARATPNSVRAERNLLNALKGLDDGGAGLGLEIIDVFTEPLRALSDGVFVTPTLIGIKMNERLVISGDLTDTAKLNLVLASLEHDKAVKKFAALIVEKEGLLADTAILADEMSHRVRNDFQLVGGLLTIHRSILSTSDQKASIDAIIRRIETLATMYNQLLGAGMGRTIDLGKYITSLCASLPAMQLDSEKKAELICVTERVLVGLSIATVVGMVVAETVANSYKHANCDENGAINVCLRRSETAPEEAILAVSDNGPGFIERAGSKRHGVGLIRRLMKQIDGTAELHSERGTTWTFRFSVEPSAGHSAS
jgi:two-component sensor histidine kinase